MKKRYKILFALLWPLAMLLYPMKYKGRELIPPGPAVICANHSNYVDPVLVALAFGRGHYMRFMAKRELFKAPVVGFVLRVIGAVPVERDYGIGAIRSAIKCLKGGDKIMIFPEGTRVSRDDAVAAKNGAVRMAQKLKVPLIPVHIPRGKRVFSRVEVSIGEPYYIETPAGRGNEADFGRLSEELMEKIRALGGSGGAS